MSPEETSSVANGASGKSATWALVDAIEALTKAGWDQEKRAEVADLLRAYRFQHTGATVARIQKLVRESGNTVLTEKIYAGKY